MKLAALTLVSALCALSVTAQTDAEKAICDEANKQLKEQYPGAAGLQWNDELYKLAQAQVYAFELIVKGVANNTPDNSTTKILSDRYENFRAGSIQAPYNPRENVKAYEYYSNSFIPENTVCAAAVRGNCTRGKCITVKYATPKTK